jgi:hypothetical protein
MFWWSCYSTLLKSIHQAFMLDSESELFQKPYNSAAMCFVRLWILRKEYTRDHTQGDLGFAVIIHIFL